MQNKLQELTDKLYNEGLSKGKQEGEQILADAKAEAAKIISDAKAEAEAIIAKAARDADEIRTKIESDVKMASREALCATRQDIEKLIVAAAAEKPVEKVLSDEEFAKEIITSVAKAFNKEESADLEFILPESLKASLEPFINDELAKTVGAGIEAKFSKKLAGGFQIGPKDGGYFISLTDETFKELISSYLRPATKKILFG